MKTFSTRASEFKRRSGVVEMHAVCLRPEENSRKCLDEKKWIGVLSLARRALR